MEQREAARGSRPGMAGWKASFSTSLGDLVRLAVQPLIPRAAVRLEPGRVEGAAESSPFDVIVVLGAPVTLEGRLGEVVRERVEAGVRAWQAGWAPWLLLTGGRTDPSVWADLRAGLYGAEARERSGVAEAVAMREHALALGVPDSAILVEDRARSTAENARFTAELMAQRGLARALLVTQPFHLRRGLEQFLRAGVEVAALDVEGSYIYSGGWASLRALYWVTREYVILTGEAVGRWGWRRRR